MWLDYVMDMRAVTTKLRFGIITTRKMCNRAAHHAHGILAIGRYCRNARFRPEQTLSLLTKE